MDTTLIKIASEAIQTPNKKFFNNIKKYEINNTCFHSIIFNDTLILSFHGSDDIQDWIDNFSYEMVKFIFDKSIKVHKGFYENYNNVLEKVIDVAKDFKGKILLTGHSLGGAIATLIALFLKSNLNNQNIDLITFGTPRVGNKAFSKKVNELFPNALRIVYRRDIVPHLPTLFIGYVHNEGLLHFNKPKFNCFIYSIKDHASNLYRHAAKGL